MLAQRLDAHHRSSLAPGEPCIVVAWVTFGELWAGRIPIPKLQAQALGLGRVHALVHALLHRVTNFPSGTQDRLIWLYDIHLLAGGCSEEEWRQFLRLCADKGIATPCLDGLRATRASFSTRRRCRPSPPPSDQRALSGAPSPIWGTVLRCAFSCRITVR